MVNDEKIKCSNKSDFGVNRFFRYRKKKTEFFFKMQHTGNLTAYGEKKERKGAGNLSTSSSCSCYKSGCNSLSVIKMQC